MSTVYVAVCKTTSLVLYVGCTDSLKGRIREHHCTGKCADWRKMNGPVEFFPLCETKNKREALRIEARVISRIKPLLNATMTSTRSKSKYLGPRSKWPKPKNYNYHPRIPRDMKLYTTTAAKLLDAFDAD